MWWWHHEKPKQSLPIDFIQRLEYYCLFYICPQICVTNLIKNYKIHTTSTQLKQVFWVGTCFWDTDIKAESNWTMSVCSACIWAGVVDKRLIQIKSKCIHLITVRRSINKYRYFRLTDASLLVPKILIDIR